MIGGLRRRVVAVAGRARQSLRSAAAPITLFVFGVLWIALPDVALAGDCPDDKGMYCLAKWAVASPLLAAAVGALLAAGAIGGWLDERERDRQRELDEFSRRNTRMLGWNANMSAADVPALGYDPGKRDPQPSACVLTTACVTALGKPDDCHELMMFRRLRDEYLARNADGMAVIDDYYRTAPDVVAAIQAGADADATWRSIYAEWVEPVVKLVDADQIDEAVALALSRYDEIKRQYKIA